MEDEPRVHFFYEEILGVPPWPLRWRLPGGFGAGDPQRGIFYEYRHDPTIDPMRRRATVVVPSLDEIAARLEEHEWPFERCRGLGAGDECLVVVDPAGHRLEVRESRLL